eukprot:SAG31_NODE_42640_length_270_cov_1.204678_1_plen_60_part_10
MSILCLCWVATQIPETLISATDAHSGHQSRDSRSAKDLWAILRLRLQNLASVRYLLGQNM